MSTVLRNTFFSTVTSGLRFLTTALLFIILARALGVEEFGRFAFAISFTGIFLAFVDYGFNLLIIKEVAQQPGNALKIAERILSGKIILFVVSTLLLFIILKILSYPLETDLIVYILWVAAAFYSFGLFFNTIFRGLNQFQYETYPTILLNGVQFILVVAMLLLGFETVSIALAYLVSRVIYFVVSLYLVNNKIGRLHLTFDFSDGYRILKESFPYGIHAILAILYFQLDTVFLSHFKGNTEVGYYQAAMRIVMASMIICDIIVSAFFPVIAKKIKADIDGFRKDGIAFNKYMILSGGSISAFIFLFSDVLIRLVYGEQYMNSIIIMQLLSVVIFLRFLGAAYAVFITVADNQNLRAIGVAVSLIVNIILNFILIPKYGAVGAAIVSIATHFVLDAIYVIFAIMLTKKSFVDLYALKGISTILLAGFLCIFANQVSPLFSLFVYIFLILTLVLTALNVEERESIKKLFNRLILREVKT